MAKNREKTRRTAKNGEKQQRTATIDNFVAVSERNGFLVFTAFFRA